MILTAPEIATLVDHMRRTGVAEIEIMDGEKTLRVVLPQAGAAPAAVDAAGPRVVKATACGHFHPGHPARDAAPALPIEVDVGEIVGVIAVGPLLQPVVAPVAGTLGRVLCAPGQRVDWGTPLFEFLGSIREKDIT